ncbi:hypothetical protein EV175_006243 [Coemansia sp. RSA 1933]|nr:hypothetical protein EV175_006243 [Coemansia sp. RSA 1933]
MTPPSTEASTLLMPSQQLQPLVADLAEVGLHQSERISQPVDEPLLVGQDNSIGAIERMDVAIDVSDNPAAKVLNARVVALFNQLFGPKPAIDASNVSLHHMSGSMTNRVYIMTIDPAPMVPRARAPYMLRAAAQNKHHEAIQMPRKYMFRIYGTGIEEILSRENELFWVSQITSLGFGPQMYGIFGNGRIEEFLESTTMTKDGMRDAMTSKNIAQRLCELHTMVSHYCPHGSGNSGSKEALYLNGKPELWTKVDEWMQLILSKWSEIRRRCDSNAQCAELLDNWHKVEHAVNTFKAHIERNVRSPLVFTHNDMLYGNILQLKHTGNVEIVDFEYSGFNYRGFDIANHFCEWMYDYSSENSHLLDPEQYPTAEERYTFLRSYVCTMASLNARIKADQDKQPSEDWINCKVAELDREVASFVPASHLFWGVQSFLKACYNEIDFDFVGRSTQRVSIFLRQVASME